MGTRYSVVKKVATAWIAESDEGTIYLFLG
mgnify:CR=1 FL=1